MQRLTIRRAAPVSLLIVAGLALGACADVTKDDLKDALVKQGIEAELAECVATDLEAQLSADDFQTVAKADTMEELSQELQDKTLEVISECSTGSGSDDTTQESLDTTTTGG